MQSGASYSAKIWVGNCPSCPPATYAPDYLNFEIIFSDIADGLVGVGLITQDQDNPGHLTLDKGYNDMSKFLNRILGMHVNKQNMLFKYFTDTLNKIIDNVSVYFIYSHNNKDWKIHDLEPSASNFKSFSQSLEHFFSHSRSEQFW